MTRFWSTICIKRLSSLVRYIILPIETVEPADWFSLRRYCNTGTSWCWEQKYLAVSRDSALNLCVLWCRTGLNRPILNGICSKGKLTFEKTSSKTYLACIHYVFRSATFVWRWGQDWILRSYFVERGHVTFIDLGCTIKNIPFLVKCVRALDTFEMDFTTSATFMLLDVEVRQIACHEGFAVNAERDSSGLKELRLSNQRIWSLLLAVEETYLALD